MNISEVRLKLVQQIVDRGVREANTIQEFIEPVAQYVVNGKIPEKKRSDIEIVQCLRGRALFLKGKGEVKTSELLERAANLLEEKISPPRKP